MSPDGGPFHPGRLLVATPLIDEPTFARTVVWLFDHDADGAFGIVLNRPSPLAVLEPLPQWHGHAALPGMVFVGGPVAPDQAIGLAEGVPEMAGATWQPLDGRLGTVDLHRDPAEFGPGLGQVRIYAGYAGWSAGQLDAEITEGAWWVVDAAAGDVLCEDPEGLWARVLARQPGRAARFARFPADPGLN